MTERQPTAEEHKKSLGERILHYARRLDIPILGWDLKELSEMGREVQALESKLNSIQAENRARAKTLLTDVEGRLATLEVKRDGSNSNELSLERALAALQKVRKELEGEREKKLNLFA